MIFLKGREEKKAGVPVSVISSGRLEKIPTGIHELDTILHGGLNRNRVFLIEGLPGTGKTTLAMQFLMEGARRGEKGAYITLSESADELHAMAESHHWSLDGIRLYEMSNVEDQIRMESQHTFYHASDVELVEATKPMLAMLDEEKPRRIAFDSLSEMRLLAGDPLRYRRQMLLLKQHFTRQNCTVLLLDDLVERQEDIQLQSICHGVIRLQRMPMKYGADRRQLTVLKLRGSNYLGGPHDCRIVTGGLQIFPRLVPTADGNSFTPQIAGSGIKELDALLGGGLPWGSSALVVGPVGVGKSVLCTQFAAAAAERGEKSVVFLFEETREHVIERADILHRQFRSFVKKGLIELRQVDPAELAPGEFIHMVREVVERDRVRHVRIDSLNGYMSTMSDEPFLMLQLHDLFTYLAHRGVVTLLTASQHGLLGERISGVVDISYLADTVISLRFFEHAGRIHRAVSVVKKRHGGHEDTIREFQISADGFKFGGPLTDFHGVLSGTPTFVGRPEELICPVLKVESHHGR